MARYVMAAALAALSSDERAISPLFLPSYSAHGVATSYKTIFADMSYARNSVTRIFDGDNRGGQTS